MDVLNTTTITMAWELYEQGLPKATIAKHLSKNRETIHLWLGNIERYGLSGFLERYEAAKRGERKGRQVDALLKRRVWAIREREMECCGQKIQYFLEREYHTHLSVPKIYEILKEKYILRNPKQRNQLRGPIPTSSKPREVVQMDTVDFGGLYAFTGIDIFSKEADILVTPALTSHDGYQFLRQSMTRRFDGHVNLIQTDGGPEFKEEFLENVHSYCDRHRVARPYRKNEQSFIESFNRTVRKECLGWQKYPVDQQKTCQKMVESFLERYHYHRPHMGLGMKTPLVRSEETDCRISTEN